jgi:hypothetical protein
MKPPMRAEKGEHRSARGTERGIPAWPDFFTAEGRQNPYPLYDRIREAQPVYPLR